MNCKDCQQFILIRDLLDPDEQEQMNNHIAQCTLCFHFQEEASRMTLQVKQGSSNIPAPANPVSLSDRIMTRVMTSERKKSTGRQLDWIMNPLMRFTLSGLSICLLVFFLVEWQYPQTTKLPNGPVAGLQQVILDSRAFRKNMTQVKSTRKLIPECLKMGKQQADLACLKERFKSIQF